MSYAAPFSLLSVHLPDRADPAEGRLTWPLAGSLVIHAVVLIAFVSLRFASSLEQSSGSYEVTLVTFQEISSSPTVLPEKPSRPERNVEKVPPPKAEVRKDSKAAPQKKAVSPPRQAVRTTNPRPQARVPERVVDSLVSESKLQVPAIPPKAVTPPPPVSAAPKPTLKQNAVMLLPPPQADDVVAPKPERVTDSLMGALDSVVVPKLRALALPQNAEPAPASPPLRQSPAPEMDVQPIHAPPPPPKLDSDVVPKKEVPRVDPLAHTLKQVVGTIAAPKKPKPVSNRVSPAVTSDAERKQDITRTPPSSGITLPSRAPRLADVAPPEARKKETPPHTARNSSTVESFTQALQSVRIPASMTTQPAQPVPEAVPFVSDASPKLPRAAEPRDMPIVLPPQAPQLAKLPVEQDQIPSQPAVPTTTSEPDAFDRQIAKLTIPQDFDAKPGFQQTERGTQDMLALQVAGSSPKDNTYWDLVRSKIARRWIFYRSEFKRSQPLQVVLRFRLFPNGQLEDKDEKNEVKKEQILRRPILGRRRF